MPTNDDSAWTNPLSFPEFRNEFFSRVFYLFCIQYLFASIFARIFLHAMKAGEDDQTISNYQTMAWIVLGLFILSFCAMLVPSWNDLSSNSALPTIVQMQFSVMLAVLIAIWAAAFIDRSLYYGSCILAVVFFAFGTMFRFGFEFDWSGVQIMLYFAMTVGGVVMFTIPKNSFETNTNYMIEGFTGVVVALLFLMVSTVGMAQSDALILVPLQYVTYGMYTMMDARYIKLKLGNFVLGNTLIYTSFAIRYVHKLTF